MDIRVIKILNDNTRLELNFTDEKDLKEGLIKATAFINLDTECGCCSSSNLTLQARPAKEGFTYVEQVCKDCYAKRGFGEYQNPKGALFLKGEWSKYTKPKNDTVNDTVK